jgi:hypothetical protein
MPTNNQDAILKKLEATVNTLKKLKATMEDKFNTAYASTDEIVINTATTQIVNSHHQARTTLNNYKGYRTSDLTTLMNQIENISKQANDYSTPSNLNKIKQKLQDKALAVKAKADRPKQSPVTVVKQVKPDATAIADAPTVVKANKPPVKEGESIQARAKVLETQLNAHAAKAAKIESEINAKINGTSETINKLHLNFLKDARPVSQKTKSTIDTLMVGLRVARDKYVKSLKKLIQNELPPKVSQDKFKESLKEAGVVFQVDCKIAIGNAKQILAKDLSLGDKFNNFCKALANLVIEITNIVIKVINAVTGIKSTPYNFYAPTRSKSVTDVEKAEKDLGEQVDSKPKQ